MRWRLCCLVRVTAGLRGGDNEYELMRWRLCCLVTVTAGLRGGGNEYGGMVIRREKSMKLGDKPIPLPLCLPRISCVVRLGMNLDLHDEKAENNSLPIS
jgi:hypothetical protein